MSADVTELTTVANDEAVTHQGHQVRRFDGLRDNTEYQFDGLHFRTLPARGEFLASFATVNDVHFGETVCGLVQGTDIGPVFSSEPQEPPYPETMNRAAIEEIRAIDPEVVIAKGDLTASGKPDEYQVFLDHYGSAFGERLVHVRGNHDAKLDAALLPPSPCEVVLPGVRLAVLDTTWPGHAGGKINAADVEWLDELTARSDRPVLVFGHHPVGDPTAAKPEGETFSLQPDDSSLLCEVAARRSHFHGYFAGHTHRNRVQRFESTGDVPFVEVSCVKDYPGSWAEYRVYEGAILQIHRRISSPDALRWSQRTRAMFNGSYAEYALGALDARCFSISGVAS